MSHFSFFLARKVSPSVTLLLPLFLLDVISSQGKQVHCDLFKVNILSAITFSIQLIMSVPIPSSSSSTAPSESVNIRRGGWRSGVRPGCPSPDCAVCLEKVTDMKPIPRKHIESIVLHIVLFSCIEFFDTDHPSSSTSLKKFPEVTLPSFGLEKFSLGVALLLPRVQKIFPRVALLLPIG